MKKILQILFLASLSLNAFAQEVKDTIPKQKMSKWSVMVAGGVTRVKKPKINVGDSYNFLSLWKYNFNGELQYRFFSKTKISIGMSYDVLEYSFTSHAYYAPINDIDTDRINFSFNNFYFLINQGFKYKKFDFYVGGGLQYGILKNNFVEARGPTHNNKVFRYSDFTNGKKVYEAIFQITTSYSFNKHFSILLFTAYIKSIKGITERKTSPVTGTTFIVYDPTYLKINLGMLYNF